MRGVGGRRRGVTGVERCLNAKMCTHCGYPLESSPVTGRLHGRCPECGMDPSDLVEWPPGVLRSCVPYLAVSIGRLGRVWRSAWLGALPLVLLLVPRTGVLGVAVLAVLGAAWLVWSGHLLCNTLRALRDWRTGAARPAEPFWQGTDAELRLIYFVPAGAYLAAMGACLAFTVRVPISDPLLITGWCVGVMVFASGMVIQRRAGVGVLRRVILSSASGDVRALARSLRGSSAVLDVGALLLTLFMLPLIGLSRLGLSGATAGLASMAPVLVSLWLGAAMNWSGLHDIARAITNELERIARSPGATPAGGDGAGVGMWPADRQVGRGGGQGAM